MGLRIVALGIGFSNITAVSGNVITEGAHHRVIIYWNAEGDHKLDWNA